MPKFIDLTGKKFGKLTVVSRASHIKGRTQWNCICDCGNKIIVMTKYLKGGNTRSCGCLRQLPSEDLTGQKFGKLIVISYAGEGKWNCSCECGKKIKVLSSSLREIKSCGCSRFKDITRKKFGKLLVISYLPDLKKWSCLCDCGKETFVFSSNLKNGNTKSCGCLRPYNLREDKNFPAKMYLYRHYRDSCAKKRGLNFSIIFEDFINLTQQECFYCGKVPMQIVKPKYARDPYIYNGLDRLYNNKGYDLDNVVACCKTCNRAKWDMNKDKFIEWIKRCHNNLKLKGIK